ncbi:MAG: hypothetical protein Q9M36_04300 [Sulfurovum sp.]|nr:hypothetical protein [Sulfurovum sp.]
MIQSKYIYLIGCITASLLVGCGSSGNNDNDDNRLEINDDNYNDNDDNYNTTTTTTTSTTTSSSEKTFGADIMPILVGQCQSCHGSNGDFTVTTPNLTHANISAMKGSATAGGQYLLDKGSNSTGHGGGMIFSTTSAEYQTIQAWVSAGALDN